MDYFSFLGIGGRDGYKEVAFSYENDLFFTKFVQEFILKISRNKIKRIVVFFTDESWEKYGKEFKEMIEQYDVIFQEKLIPHNISSEEFVEILKKEIKSKDIVIDITHSFRNMTIKFLFMLRYIEESEGVNIKNIYYSKILESGEEARLEDFVADFKNQELGEALSLFDNTLFIDTKVIKKLKTKDNKLLNLVNHMSSMNLKMETADLEGSLKSCKNICDACRSIINDDSKKYTIITPFVQGIFEKFKIVNEQKNECYRAIEIIKLFASHNRTQAAITFIDQLFRSEIINCFVKNIIIANDTEKSYLLSQRILYGSNHLNLRDYKDDNNISDFDKYIEIDKKTKHIVLNNAKTINRFYNEVRNKVNHGQSIEIDVANKLIEDMLKVIKVIRERGGINEW